MIGLVMAGGRGSRMAATMAAATAGRQPRQGGGDAPPVEKLLLLVASHAGGGGGNSDDAARRRKPVVAHVIDTLAGCDFIETVVAVTGPNSPHTRRMLQDVYGSSSGSGNSGSSRKVRITDSAGAGYSRDLGSAVQSLLRERRAGGGGDAAVLVVPGDMPLLDEDTVARVSDRYARDAWTSIVTSRTYAERWGMEPEYGVVVNGTACCYTGVSIVGLQAVASQEEIAQRHVLMDDHRVAFTLNTMRDYERLLLYDDALTSRRQ